MKHRVDKLRAAMAVFFCVLLMCSTHLHAQQPAGMDTGTVERCKAATALVRPDKGGRGSSFCIHNAGLFLASHHVVGNSEGVTLVLNSGSAAEKPVKGRVIRSDQQLDIVLIHAAELEGGYAYMPLGAATDLVERLEVTAFGYPYPPGTFPSQKNPVVKADIGHVTAYKSEEGRIVRVETDTIVFGGNSGGAMVNRQGLVIGAVAAGKPGKPLSYAIPVNRIRDFLGNSAIVFDPLPILESEKRKPTDFECRVFLFDNAETTNVTVQLTLSSEFGPPAVVDLRAAGKNVYRATAVPCAADAKVAPGQEQSLKYSLVARQGDKQVGLSEGNIPLIAFEHGLVSWLTFADGDAPVVRDASGNGNNGMLGGNPIWVRNGSNSVVELDGVDDVIDIDLAKQGGGWRARSLLLRLRSLPVGGAGMWVESGVDKPVLELLTMGVLPGWPDAWGSFMIEMAGPMQNIPLKPLGDGKWHDVVFVCDAEAGRGRMFVDGEAVVGGGVSDVAARGNVVSVGRVRAGPDKLIYLRGQIGEVRIYDRALTPGELRLLFRKRI